MRGAELSSSGVCRYRGREYRGPSDAVPETDVEKLPNPDVITEEDMVLVCSSLIANHYERQIVSMR